MAVRTYDGLERLASRAAALSCGRSRAPALLVLTDPVRTPDPLALARRMPAGAGLILRTFGRPEIEAQAYELTHIAALRGFKLLIAADAELAWRSGAAGVHLPRWARLERPWPDAVVTASVHDQGRLRHAQDLADGLLISTVFASESPSAGRPMGPFRLAAWARRSRAPVYALGGVTEGRTGRLKSLGVAGIAVVGAAARISSA